MKRIIPDQIEDGMVLAKPIVGPSGNILLNSGLTLKSGLAPRLKTWDISVIYIESDDDNFESGEKKENIIKAEKDRLDTVFELVKSDPRMLFLYSTALKYFSNK
ncbi:MAG: hypothetical protein ABIA63_09995 [bacterium]